MEVKPLPKPKKTEIEEQNKARRMADLTPIVIKIRKCLGCNGMFESAGERMCGCNSGKTFTFPEVAI